MRTNNRLMTAATLVLAALGSSAYAGQNVTAQGASTPGITLASGSLDTTFNKSGKVFQGFTTSGGGFATQVVTLPNGKAIVAHELEEGTLGTTTFRSFIVVRRLNEDGSLDRTFGGLGKTSATIKGFFPVLQPRAMVVAPDGRIFIAATGFNSTGSSVRPLVFALTASGTLDPTFAGDGSLTPVTAIANPSTNRIFAEDLVYDPATNNVTLGGTVEPKNGNDSFLWTYTVDANNVNFPQETTIKEPGANLQFAKLRQLPGDEMLVAAGITPSDENDIPRAYLVRQLGNGLVTRKAIDAIGLETFIAGLQVDGSRVFLAGAAFTNGFQTHGYVARFDLETLTRDTAFGSNGIRLVGNEVRDLAFSKGSGTAKKVIVVGTDGTDYMAARMSYGGQIDSSFGNNGIVLVNFSNAVDERALAVSVDSKNRIWGAGLTEPLNDSGFRAGVFRLLP